MMAADAPPPPAPRASARVRGVVPLGTVAAGALVAAGAALLFVPSREETALRLIEDGNVSRAAEVMDTTPSDVPRATPTAAQPAAPAAPEVSPEEAMSLFTLAIESGRLSALDDADAAALVAPLADPLAAAEKLRTRSTPLPPAVQRRLFAALGDRLLALGHPADAVPLFNDARRGGDADHSLANRAVTALRWSDQAEAAFQLVETLRREAPDDAGRWDDVRFALLRETDRSAQALEEKLAAVPAGSVPGAEEMAVIVECAGECGQTARTLPLLRSFLAAQPAGARFLGEKGASAEPDAALRGLARHFADFSAWNDRPADAFTAYAELARRGDAEALAQCIALYDGLDRDDAMAELLASRPLESLPADHLALAARLWTAAGRVPEAAAARRLQLRQQPGDTQTALKLADLLVGTSDYAAAAAVCRETLRHAPGDAALTRRLAQADLAEGRLDEALTGFSQLSADPADAEAQETTACLAEALDRPAVQATALRATLAAVPDDAATVDSLALALFAASQPAEAVKTLRTAAERAPASAPRAIALARAALDTSDPATAIAALAKPRFARNREAVECLLDAAVDVPAAASVLDYLRKNDAARTVAVDPALGEFRLSLLESEAHAHAAAAIAASGEAAPSPPATSDDDEPDAAGDRLRAAADAAFEQKDYTTARRAMEAYLQHAPDAPAEAWSYLGTICKALGDRAASRAAYQRFLQRLGTTAPPAGHDHAAR